MKKRALLLLTLGLFSGLGYTEQTGNCTAGTEHCEQNSLTTTNTTTTTNTNTNTNTNNNTNTNTNTNVSTNTSTNTNNNTTNSTSNNTNNNNKVYTHFISFLFF